MDAPLTGPSLLQALGGAAPLDELCRKAGLSEQEFAARRDAFLREQAAIGDQTHAGAVGGKVEIIRDRAGVPHVYADSTADLYYGLGIAMAQDRLWQMDRLRRRALGRQAEILGPSFLASDIAHLTVGIDLIAERETGETDAATKAVVERFVAGINRQIEIYGAGLPIEFLVLGYTPAPFTLRDVIAIARGIWWSLNGRIDRLIAAEASRMMPTEELRRLYLTPEASENLVLPEAGGTDGTYSGTDDATGSNNWAVSGARTGTGQAVMCGDPHQPFWVPSSWYEYALHGPEDDAAGAGHPGVPGLWWGSNGDIAWSLTNNAASTRDLYREETDPARPGQYRDGDTWRAFEERSVSIPVQGAADHALTIRSTVRGPVVNALVPALEEGGDPPMSLRWVGAEHLDDLRASIGLARARDWTQFRAVLRDWSVAVFNYVYADREGHVGYQMSGRIPIRGRAHPGVRDAGNPEDAWSGYIPYDSMPSSFDPARGYVASANQRIVGENFPYPIYGAYSQGHRGVRIDEQFAAPNPADKAASIRLQNDVVSARAQRIRGRVIGLLQGSSGAEAALIVKALSAWDCSYATGSSAPTIFETFMWAWNRATLRRHLPERLIDLAQQQTGLSVSLLEGAPVAYFPEGLEAIALACAKQSVEVLRKRLGEDPAGWSWGRVHQAHWRHVLSNPANDAAFDIGPASVDGGSHTIRNTGGELPPHAASSGAEYRIVVDFAAPDSFLAVQNIGNSGVPGSAHYRDQFQPWIDGAYHVVHLRRADVEADRESTIFDPARLKAEADGGKLHEDHRAEDLHAAGRRSAAAAGARGY